MSMSLQHHKEDEPPMPPRHGSTQNSPRKNTSGSGSMRGNIYGSHSHSQSMPRLPLAPVESPNKRGVPIWDSSDPARAPPPLPLNPNLNADGTPQLTNTRASATITAAAQALHEKALRDSAPMSVSPYTTNAMAGNGSVLSAATGSTAVGSDRFSPVKSFVSNRESSPSPAHRRLQSVVPSVRDMRAAYDNRTGDRTGRADTPSSGYGDRRNGSPCTPARVVLRTNVAAVDSRSSSRSPTKALGEGTPPSAAMLALQSLARDDDWSSKGLGLSGAPTTGSGLTPSTSYAVLASSEEKPPMDALAGQIDSLTGIATRLQTDLAQLSRRSRDNATDLTALKEATHARDEDIRQSLRDLLRSVNTSKEADSRTPTKFAARLAAAVDENGPANQNSNGGHEWTAALAMLDKIVREMGTRDGQEKLLVAVDRVSRRRGTEPNNDTLDSPVIKEVGGNDISSVLGGIREAVAAAGGAVTELQTQQSALRADVSGLGRDLMRRVEDALAAAVGLGAEVAGDRSVSRLSMAGSSVDGDSDIGPSSKGPTSAAISAVVAEVVRESLADLKSQLQTIVERPMDRHSRAVVRQQSDDEDTDDDQRSETHTRGDALEVTMLSSSPSHIPMVDKEALAEAVRAAYADIAIHQGGLDREEILQLLRDGVETETDKKEVAAVVHAAVKNSLSELLPKQIVEEKTAATPLPAASPGEYADVIREAIAATVKETLKDGRWPAGEVTVDREDVVAAVRAGLDAGGICDVDKALDRGRDAVVAAVESGLSTVTADVRRAVDQIVRIEWADDERTARELLLDAVGERVDGMEETLRAVLIGRVAEGAPPEEVDVDPEGLIGAIKAEVQRVKDILAEMASIHKATVEAADSGRDAQTATISDSVSARFDTLDTWRGEVESAAAARGERLKDLHAVVGTVDDKMGNVKTEVAAVAAAVAGVGVVLDTVSTAVKEAASEAADGREKTFVQIGGLVADVVLEVDKSLAAAVARVQEIVDGRTERNEAVVEAVTEVKTAVAELHTVITGFKTDHVDREKSAAEADEKHQEEKRARRENKLDKLAFSAALVAVLDEAIPRLAGDDVTAVKAAVEKLSDDMAAITSKTESALATDDLKDSLHTSLAEKIDTAVMEAKTAIETAISESGTARDGTVESKVADGVVTLKVELERLFEEAAQKSDDLAAAVESRAEKGEAILNELLELARQAVAVPETELALTEGTREVDDAVEVEEVVEPEPDKLDVVRDELRADVKSVESLLSALSGKLEELDAGFRAEASAVSAASMQSATKDDVTALETAVGDVVTALETVKAKLEETAKAAEKADDELPNATKEDVLDVKTLVAATDEKLDSLVAAAAEKADFESLTTKIDATASSVDKLAAVGATKEDVAVVQLLVDDLKTALETELERKKLSREAREARETEETPEELADESDAPAKKKDLDVLGVVCVDLKNKLVELTDDLAKADSVATKETVEALTAALTEFRESHDKMRDSYEDDIRVTAKAFDDRATEAVAVLAAVSGVEATILGVKDIAETVQTKIDELSDKVSGFDDRISEVRAKDDDDDKTAELVAEIAAVKVSVAAVMEAVELVNASVSSAANNTDLARALDLIGTVQSSIDGSQPQLAAEIAELKDASATRAAVSDDKISARLNELAAKLEDVLAVRTADSDSVSRLSEIEAAMQTSIDRLAAMAASQEEQLAALRDTAAKEKEAARAELATVRAERDAVAADRATLETEKASLATEKDHLLAVVAALQTDRDEMAARKARVAADVAALETALRIRREEMSEMESKADRLERRILDGIMDQSRALLLARSKLGTPLASPTIGPTASVLSRRPGRRGPSTPSASTVSTSSVGGQTAQSRRIFSLNQISNPANAPSSSTGSGLGLHTAVIQGLAGNGIKRSNSLKGHKSRKTSWGHGDGGGATTSGGSSKSRRRQSAMGTATGPDGLPTGDGQGHARTLSESSVSASCSDSASYDSQTGSEDEHDGDDDHDGDTSFASSIVSSDVTYDSTYLTTPAEEVGLDRRARRRKQRAETSRENNRRRSSGFTGNTMDEIEEEDESGTTGSDEDDDEETPIARHPDESILSVDSAADVMRRAQEVGL